MVEAICLRWDAEDNACIVARLSTENSGHFDALNGVAVATVVHWR